ncbi:indole-3-acetic acid-induced protein ARG7-like [Typha latifolia]|uniref:indole-3-acetic acid-induced protein ARG7-like n=1 Tax=Typha latifolia TaxID=4733 RepID=UPI003C2CFE1B
MGKCSKIRHIVWLRQMLRRWRARAAAKTAPADVPAGHVAVCVGSGSRRFVVRAAHLNHPAFRQLLRQAEEEYGFPTSAGPLALPCDEFAFENILRHISSSSSKRFGNLEARSCYSHEGIRDGWRGESLPLLQG